MNAYSYKRWSSDKQTAGDSLRRQTERAKQICVAHKWRLIDLPPDAGVSAWKGKNLHKGALSQFLKKVEAGEIETPCVLIVEKLDRFSRAQADEVIPLFLNLLKSGVEVFSDIENVHYTREQLKSNPLMAIMQMTMAFVAANQYSTALSDRITRVKQNQIELACKGIKTRIPRCPAFFTWTGSDYVANEKSAVVQRIFRMYSDGLISLQGIAAKLNQDKVPPMGPAAHWVQGLVRKVLTSRFVLGEYKNRKDYFPRIITDEEFNHVATLLGRNKNRRGRKSDRINILKGLIFCKECGKPVNLFSAQGHNYWRCVGRYQNVCSQKHMAKMDVLEVDLFAMILQTTPEVMIGSHNVKADKEIKAISAKMSQVSGVIRKTVDLLAELDMPELQDKLTKLLAERNELEAQLKERQAAYNLTSELPKTYKDLRLLMDSELVEAHEHVIQQLKLPEVRKQLVLLLPNIIERIEVEFDKPGIEVNVQFVSDGVGQFNLLH